MPVITWIDGLMGGNQPKYALMPEGPEWIFSHQSTVKAALRKKALSIYGKSLTYHAIVQQRYPGASTWIEFEGPHTGRWLDYRIHLYSKNGSRAAHAIEFGHTGIGVAGPLAVFQVEGKRYPGAFILHRAAGISPRKGFR